MTPPLGIGALIAQSFRLLFANFATLFPLAFVPALLLAILGYLTDTATPPPSDPAEVPDMGLGPGALLLGLLASLIGFFVMGFMALAALDAVIGKRHTVGEYTAQTLRHFLPIVGLGIALSFALVVGLLLFIVPGLYIAARYLPWIQTVVFENAGWSGLGRARDLTEGYRWPLVAALLLFGLLVLAAAFVIAPLAVTIGGPLAVLVEAVLTGLYYALVSIFGALIYARLREIKEGLSIPQIAALID
jgi:hypothetical protein